MKEGRTIEARGGRKKGEKGLEVERGRHDKSRRFCRVEVLKATRVEDLRVLEEFQVHERRDKDR